MTDQRPTDLQTTDPQTSATILFFPGVRRDRAECDDIAAAVAAAVLAGKVQRFPAGARTLPAPKAPPAPNVCFSGDAGGRVLPFRGLIDDEDGA